MFLFMTSLNFGTLKLVVSSASMVIFILNQQNIAFKYFEVMDLNSPPMNAKADISPNRQNVL